MVLIARYPGKCRKCGGPIRPGQEIDWDKDTKATRHVKCPEQTEVPTAAEPVALTAGGVQAPKGRNRRAAHCDRCGLWLDPGEGRLVRCYADTGCMQHFDEDGWHVYCLDAEACKARAAERRAAEKAEYERLMAEKAEKERQETEAAARGKALLAEVTQGLLMAEEAGVYTQQGETLATWTEGGVDHTLRRETLDGQMVYVHSIRGFDDYRDHLYAPAAIIHRIWDERAKQAGITAGKAQEWLAQYRGCVGTGMYEYIAAKGAGERA